MRVWEHENAEHAADRLQTWAIVVAADSAHPLLAALDAAGVKPGPRDERDEKKNYAERLSTLWHRLLLTRCELNSQT